MSAHAVEVFWLLPDRRTQLRAGATPKSAQEAAYQDAYRAHQEERRAADARRT